MPDESVIYRTKLHKAFYLYPLVSALLCALSATTAKDSVIAAALAALSGVGILLAGLAYLIQARTEIAAFSFRGG